MVIEHDSSTKKQIAQAARAFQRQSTGQVSKRVSVLLGAETLVITLHEALSPAEIALSSTAAGAQEVQDFHRQLFATSSEAFRQSLNRITGRQVRKEAAKVESSSQASIHAFTNGTMVQVFLFAPKADRPGQKKVAPVRRTGPRRPAK